MSELFDEVDEEVRREQLKKLWDKYSIYLIALAVVIIAGVGGWRGYQYLEAKKAAEAGATFDRAVELADQNKHAEAEAAFADLAAKAPAGYRILARLRTAAGVGYTTATDLADWLVRAKGVPFREAHGVSARVVRLAEEKGCALTELALADLQVVDPRIEAGAMAVLDVDRSVASRTSYGGTAPARVLEAVAAAERRFLAAADG